MNFIHFEYIKRKRLLILHPFIMTLVTLLSDVISTATTFTKLFRQEKIGGKANVTMTKIT